MGLVAVVAWTKAQYTTYYRYLLPIIYIHHSRYREANLTVVNCLVGNLLATDTITVLVTGTILVRELICEV